MLAGCLMAATLPVDATQTQRATAGAPERHAEQRALLEAYVDCIRRSGAGDAFGPPRAPASACAGERAAYASTLPEERATAILEALDAGPRAAARR